MENFKLDLKMLEDICQADGISGNEKEASRVMKKYLEGYADEFSYDNLGSLIALKKGTGNGPKVMISGHIDEVGFMVKKIEDSGFIRLQPVGGWWPHVMPSHLFTLTTRENNKYVGVIGTQAPHGLPAEVRDKVMKIEDMYLDLGVANKEEIEKMGIRIGDMITPRSKFRVMNNPDYLLAKAWDDRVGAAMAIDIMKNLKGIDHCCDLYSVGTVQEEVGLRGAKTATYAVKPDIMFALDVTLASDVPNGKYGVKMGTGVTLSLMDSSHLDHKGLLAYMENLCKELDLSYEVSALPVGGTDSGEAHKSFDGVINLTLSVPSRYIHSSHSMIHAKDYESTVKVLTEFVKRVDTDLLEELRNSNR